MNDLTSILIQAHLTVRDALAHIDRGRVGIALMVDDAGVLLRTVTDGDLRRLLLGGVSLEDPLSRLPPLHSVTVPEGLSNAEIYRTMVDAGVDHLPVVDGRGRPLALHRLRDLAPPIYLSPPHLSERELAFVQEAFDSNWIAPLGPHVDAFERELAARVGCAHAAAVNSGTAAIHLALHLLGVGPGDTVCCSSFTFVATAAPVRYLGAEPVFIDSEPETWNMSPRALERALDGARRAGRPPRAVIVVNLYGQSADMDSLRAICDSHGVPIVEDAAESLGATYKGRASGTFGRLGVYSFNGNKIITTSGGGMLVSDDEELVRHGRKLATQAREPVPHYEHTEIGYNYRLSNVLAAIGRGQLQVLDERVAARRANFERYAAALADVPALRWMPEAPYGRHTRWLTTCTLDPERTRATPEQVASSFSCEGIEVRRVWKPMHRQPVFQGCAYYPYEEGRSVSDELFATGLCLPSGSSLTEDDVERIAHHLRTQLA